MVAYLRAIVACGLCSSWKKGRRPAGKRQLQQVLAVVCGCAEGGRYQVSRCACRWTEAAAVVNPAQLGV